MSTTHDSTQTTRDAPAPSSANTAGSDVASRAAAPRTHAPRHDVVEWLRAKLAAEKLEATGDYSAAELAYRRAWNARGTALLADLALYVGLAELAACDVGMSGVVAVDLSDAGDR